MQPFFLSKSKGNSGALLILSVTVFFFSAFYLITLAGDDLAERGILKSGTAEGINGTVTDFSNATASDACKFDLLDGLVDVAKCGLERTQNAFDRLFVTESDFKFIRWIILFPLSAMVAWLIVTKVIRGS